MGLIKFIISAVLVIIFLYFTITGIQNVMQAQENLEKANERVHKALERQRLLISKGCIQTGVDPVSNNEIWNCPEGTNIPPLETN
jgi:hypothetical protein